MSDSWRMDETYIKVKGKWVYYQAVDKFGNVIDYYLSQNRDETAAKVFINHKVVQNCLPSKHDEKSLRYQAMVLMTQGTATRQSA